MPAGPRVEPGLRRLLPAELRFARGDDARAGGEAAHARARRGVAELRDVVARRHSVEHWADGVLATVTRPMILHVQKVAGISGSEAHLLSLLPAPRARLGRAHADAARGRAGRLDFARALEARGVPIDAIPSAPTSTVAFVQLVGYLLRRRPEILHTHLVHAEGYALLAGAVARIPVRFTTKHGFKSSARRRTSASPTGRSRASPTCTSRSRAGSRATSPTSRASTRELRDRPLRHRARRLIWQSRYAAR